MSSLDRLVEGEIEPLLRRSGIPFSRETVQDDRRLTKVVLKVQDDPAAVPFYGFYHAISEIGRLLRSAGYQWGYKAADEHPRYWKPRKVLGIIPWGKDLIELDITTKRSVPYTELPANQRDGDHYTVTRTGDMRWLQQYPLFGESGEVVDTQLFHLAHQREQPHAPL